MKVKTKKQFTLPQLIEWVIDNDIKHRVFESNPNFDGVTYELGFDIDGDLYFEEYLAPTSLFTVEVEEEITEDTVIPKMLVIGRFDGYEEVYNRKISHFNQHLLSAYLIHDDGHMELIYDEVKGLVE